MEKSGKWLSNFCTNPGSHY